MAGSPTRPDGELALVCRPNLDIWAGLASRYRTRHGNLRSDGVEAVLDQALAHGVGADAALWFTLDPLPAPAEVAARHGNSAGLGIPGCGGACPCARENRDGSTTGG